MAARINHLCLAAAAVASVLTLAACGSGGGADNASTNVQADNGEAAKTGPQVLKDAVAAMTAAGSVHVTGSGTEGVPAHQVSYDMQLTSDGMSVAMTSSAGTWRMISIGKVTYMKGTGALGGTGTTSGIYASLAKKYANTWLKSTEESDSSSGSGSDSGSGSSESLTIDDDTNTIAGLGKSLIDPDDGVTIDPAVTRGSLNGQDVVIVKASDGSSFDIAATGKPYLLQAHKVDNTKDGSEGGTGTLTFADYGKRISITAPANAVDMQTLDDQLDPSAFPTELPSDFPTDLLPSDLPTDFPSGSGTSFSIEPATPTPIG